MNQVKTIIQLNKKIQELQERIDKKDKEIEALRREVRKRGKEKTKARGRVEKTITLYEELVEALSEIDIPEEINQKIETVIKEEKEPEEVVIFDINGKERRFKKWNKKMS